MTRYRVELWIDGEEGGEDRMPDVNRVVRAKSPERAVKAATLTAKRASGYYRIVLEDHSVFPEGARS